MNRSLLLWPVLGAAALATANLLLAQPTTSPQQQPAPPAANAAPTAQVERGRYLVQLGDCVACHTQKGGARLAGGRPVGTPFGRLLSANLTPDTQTGIGRYNPDTFYRAMHEGIDHEGRHLYPAFPYNYYTQVTREDSDAMFAYLRTVPAVNHAVDRNQLPFPFNIRQLMIVWNAMFLDKGPYKPVAGKPPEWNRGAYLVEGLGHCQACHTPKNMLGANKDRDAFRGGTLGVWFAPDLTGNRRTGLGGWDDATLREFLRSGANTHSAASGEMGEVVAFSTSQMNDADIAATIAYLRTIAPSPDLKVEAPDAQVMKQGEAIFQDACAACHRMDGSGVPRLFPPIRGDANLQQSDPATLIHFVLAGTRKVPVDASPTPLSMPAFGWKLSDQQVAAVLTYSRNSWGNSAPAVTGKQVEDLRKKLKLETQPRAEPPVDLAHPGALTLSTANTDSRANGTGDAGKAAPASDKLPTTAGQASGAQGGGSAPSGQGGSGGSNAAGSGAPKEKGGGRPAGVPAGGG
ncbi:c-type cytochrome [Ramlibacter humi]|uniref:C-type cytochrome n=1 Tax=Ramlibacter humi TaxID=2530451 RepID=A0A4Z0BH10_9BURK|nr:cytochrome c [Ramlibacter humi]TFY97198.1 c-type cytochrome [Ramlibacter humi]